MWILILALLALLSAACGGWVISGALRSLARYVGSFPSQVVDLHRRVLPSWVQGPRLLRRHAATALLVLGLVELNAISFVLLFLFSSPLFALRFFNHLTGRPPPHGVMARCYDRLAERRWRRPPSCPRR